MPRTWSRLHEHLGCPPGPITFAIVRRCVDDRLAEADDLDWKELLPNGQNPHQDAEFAKDVAAMANTRGGLIIFGVTDQVEFTGIRAVDANPDQYAQWVRNLVQPYLSGLEQYVLLSDDGSEAVFVVDVPASEPAPHSVDFVDIRAKAKAKSQRATVTPYRRRSGRKRLMNCATGPPSPMKGAAVLAPPGSSSWGGQLARSRAPRPGSTGKPRRRSWIPPVATP